MGNGELLNAESCLDSALIAIRPEVLIWAQNVGRCQPYDVEDGLHV